MADPLIQNDAAQQQKPSAAQASDKRNPVRSAFFKYYIHDGVDCLRLQLIGDFSETAVPDLNGCWNTVRTTIGVRKFLLDLNGLRSADDPARQWIVRMVAEGATLSPEKFLLDGASPAKAPAVPNSLRGRIASLLRGSSTVGA